MPPRAETPRPLWTRALSSFGNGVLGLGIGVRLLLCGTWMAGIWFLSSRQQVLPPGAESVLWVFFANLAHAPLFGLLAMWIALCLLPRRATGGSLAQGLPGLGWFELCLVLVLVLGFGVLDEWHQSWVPGREATAKDVLIDGIGAANVLWVASYLARGQAEEAGLRRRLLLGLLFCAGATALLTYVI